MVLFSINSQGLFQIVTTDFTAVIAAMLHVLAHALKDPLSVVYSFTRSYISSYHIYTLLFPLRSVSETP
jgi:hypothetical protein